jgi:hypothetical protein
MKPFCFLCSSLFLVFSLSCKNSNNSSENKTKVAGNSSTIAVQNVNDSIFENYIVDTIFSLKEVREKNKYIDSFTNHRKGIAAMVNKSSENKYEYEIAVGYNGEDRFETYNIFYFDSATKQISILDVISGDKIGLEDWRKKKL